MYILKTLNELLKHPGISGFEMDFSNYICHKLSEYCDNAVVLGSGSVKGVIKSKKPNAPTIMLEAHLDRIGLIVSSVDENGFVGFSTLGGVDERILPAAQVRIIGKEDVFGIIGAKPPHLLNKGEESAGIDIKDMLIDTGLGAEAQSKISVGDSILLDSRLSNLIGTRVTSAALDNRAGMAAIFACLDALQGKELPYNLQIAFTTSEELGLHGAYGIIDKDEPDLAVIVDVTYGETPDSDKSETFPLGCGAVICRGPNLDYEKTKKVIALAEKKNIPYEIEVAPENSGTNAWAIQTSGKGIPCVLLSIPLRYMHTTVETIDLCDVKWVSRLIFEIVCGGDVIA